MFVHIGDGDGNGGAWQWNDEVLRRGEVVDGRFAGHEFGSGVLRMHHRRRCGPEVGRRRRGSRRRRIRSRWTRNTRERVSQRVAVARTGWREHRRVIPRFTEIEMDNFYVFRTAWKFGNYIFHPYITAPIGKTDWITERTIRSTTALNTKCTEGKIAT